MKNTITCIFLIIALYGPSFSVYGQVRKVEMTKSGGVYYIPCVVNNIPMNFIFDTGASGILLSKEIVQMMHAKGAFAPEDIIGMTQSQIANGEIVDGVVIELRSFGIAGIWLKDVTAQVSLSLNAPLLLGTDILERFGSFTIDYRNNLLLLGDEPNKFMEELSKIFRLHKYEWGASVADIEALEKSEKLRVKLITGQYTDWKLKSALDGSTSLNYKIRLAGLVLGKNYSFADDKLKLEMFSVLNEGLMSGNPDSKAYNLPLDLAYKVYFKLDSLMRVEAYPPADLCIGKSGYDCINSQYSEEAVYGQFFPEYLLPLDLSSKNNFRTTIVDLLQEARENGAIRPDQRLQIIHRWSRYNKDGYYELNVSTANGFEFEVWLIVRQKMK